MITCSPPRAVLTCIAFVASLSPTLLDAQSRPAPRHRPDVRIELEGTPTVPGPPITIEYTLPAAAKNIHVEVLDSARTIVRTFPGTAGEPTPSGNAGRNRLTWDLRHDGPTLLDPQAEDAQRLGPFVLPGKYEIRVTADGKSASRAVTVNKASAPASVPDAVLKARFAVAIEARDRASEVTQAILDIRAMKAQVADRAKNAKSPPVGLAADVVNRKLNEVEQLLAPLGTRLAELRGAIERGTGRPDEEHYRSLREVSEGATAARDRLRGVLRNEVAAFNRMLGNAQMAPIEVPERLREPTTPPPPGA